MVGGFILTALLAQSGAPPGPAASAGNPVDLERIRTALAEQPAITTTSSSGADGRPVFKMAIESWKVGSLWADISPVPSYIRSRYPSYHDEFLRLVTPEDFRAGTLYPAAIGLPIGPLLELLGKQMAWPHRKTKQERARDEVRQALDEVLACRADPTRAGC